MENLTVLFVSFQFYPLGGLSILMASAHLLPIIYISGTFLPQLHSTSVFLRYFKSIIPETHLHNWLLLPHSLCLDHRTLALPLINPLLHPHHHMLVDSDFHCFLYLFLLFYYHQFTSVILFLINF